MLSQNKPSSVIVSEGDTAALKKLILQAKEGDSSAFGELYTQLYVPLYRYTFSKCRDSELSNDICQQAFLTFYKTLTSYTPDKSPLAYLFTIAKHLLINHNEKKTFSSLEEIVDQIEDTSSFVDTLDIHRMSQEINSYLPYLSQDEQDVIRMFFYAELSYKEISSILEKEEVYLRKIKERALKKLRVLSSHLHEQ